MANYNLGKLDLRRRDLIIRVCDELEEGRLDGNFPAFGLADGKRDPDQYECK